MAQNKIVQEATAEFIGQVCRGLGRYLSEDVLESLGDWIDEFANQVLTHAVHANDTYIPATELERVRRALQDDYQEAKWNIEAGTHTTIPGWIAHMDVIKVYNLINDRLEKNQEREECAGAYVPNECLGRIKVTVPLSAILLHTSEQVWEGEAK